MQKTIPFDEKKSIIKNTKKNLFLQNQIIKCQVPCYKYLHNLSSDIPLVTYTIEVHHQLQKTIPFVTKYLLQYLLLTNTNYKRQCLLFQNTN